MKRFIFVKYPVDLKSEAEDLMTKIKEHLTGTKETIALIVPERIVISEYLARTREEIFEELAIIGGAMDDGDDEDFIDAGCTSGRQVN